MEDFLFEVVAQFGLPCVRLPDTHLLSRDTLTLESFLLDMGGAIDTLLRLKVNL